MFVKELVGHSGCHLSLHKEGEVFFVRKASPTLSYNPRLRKQCAKQMRFSSTTASTPRVLSRGMEGDKFYFDMEFVQGRTVAESAGSMSILDIAEFVKIFLDNLPQAKGRPSETAPILFHDKIEQLRETTRSYPRAQEAVALLANCDWRSVEDSPCHGDLTLENILVTPHKDIFVIDLLDSFYDSWLMDMAKLLQDLELGWSFRALPADVTRDFRLLVAKEALLDEIKKRDQDGNLLATVYRLLLLSVLRIYPYAKDEATVRFLDLSVEKVMHLLNAKP